MLNSYTLLANSNGREIGSLFSLKWINKTNKLILILPIPLERLTEQFVFSWLLGNTD